MDQNESKTTCITEVVDGRDIETFSVHKNPDGTYEVRAGMVPRHTSCTPEDVMRALSNYLQSLVFELDRLKYPDGF